MRILGQDEIRKAITPGAAIDAMREALLAQARGECDTPMPMHLDLLPSDLASAGGEVHVKASYRQGGKHFALKMAGSFGVKTNGMMMLVSAESGDVAAYFADQGYLTDLRTAAVSAMVARELGRKDAVLGLLGTGVQARLQADLHAAVLPLEEILVWGRSHDRALACAREIGERLPAIKATVVDTPAEIAARSRLIVTATASRAPLLRADEIQPGTHLSAVGSDSPGKQELDPAILRRAVLLLVDSPSQCERLGELQHAPAERSKAVEIGAYCAAPVSFDREGITVADFTGLGVEDLYIAEACLG